MKVQHIDIEFSLKCGLDCIESIEEESEGTLCDVSNRFIGV